MQFQITSINVCCGLETLIRLEYLKMSSRCAHIEQALCITHALLTISHWGYVYSAKLLTANIFRMVSNVIHVFRTTITCAGRGRGFVPSPWQRITPSTTCRLLGDQRTRREKSTSPPTLRHKQVETQFTWVLNRPLPPIEYSLLRLKGLQIIANETMLHVIPDYSGLLRPTVCCTDTPTSDRSSVNYKSHHGHWSRY